MNTHLIYEAVLEQISDVSSASINNVHCHKTCTEALIYHRILTFEDLSHKAM